MNAFTNLLGFGKGKSKASAQAKNLPSSQRVIQAPRPRIQASNSSVLTSNADIGKLPARIAQFRMDIAGQDHASKFCPIVMDNGDWAILVTPEYLHSDILFKVISKCKSQNGGKDLKVYQITSTLLLTLREGRSDTTKGRVTTESRSAYKAAFLEILSWGVRNKASDVHMNVSNGNQLSQIYFTVDGNYIAPPRWRIPTDRLQEILNVAWQDTKGGASPVFNGESEQQCRVNVTVDGKAIMGRWASMATDKGPSVCLRLLNLEESVVTLTLEEQGFLPSHVAMLTRALTSEGGALISAGVVGSGKSTTIATTLGMRPSTRKLITMEDPVEYLIPQALQNTISRSLEGGDENAFSAKLKTIKRSAPNDLLIGEIRDPETGLAFMDMAGTGTKVYTTVHAKSHFQIPERLASSAIGIPNSFLASPGILNLLIYQALIPVICPHCAISINEFKREGGADSRGVAQKPKYWEQYYSRIERLYNFSADLLRIRNLEGCEHCRRSEVPELNGYIGRTVVAEMLEPNTDREVLRCIMAGDTLRLQEHLESLERSSIDNADMTNKSIMECALYKATKGLFDPRDIEIRTRSFETDELIKNQYKRRKL
ncbi:type IV B pilus protein [Pseudomonas luteola]|uniref:Flp pilus assembly complex ATPase component TadA n=1 Tax=Pseudomonas luteola TaxID=47886 RepID=A0A2X2BYR2_PSELU|nr:MULTISPECIES: ATPase, T2SS/T4P/T4SS family [Pseudomonas]MBA1250238.1 Flp pilus assembly complex ATPase component TadA [Pseudomonas zeshuii]MBH3441762.1 Flp pilus assembly complex ATPase component TadA [Pseudomonas luteola]SPY99901.1 type IV B pilus protein [Pseudomonas luteola]SPZ00077.1 type IV B pilus protein [Pseudomonas luteola]